MKAFRYSSAAALILVAFGSTCPMFAQPTPAEIDNSHDLKQFPLPTGNSEDALLQRLKNYQLADTMRNHGMLGGEGLDYFKQHPEAMLELLRKNGLKPEAIEAIKKNPALLKMAYDRIERGEGLPPGLPQPSGELNNALRELSNQTNEPGPQPQSRPNTNPAPAEAERSGQTGQPIKPPEPIASDAAASRAELPTPEVADSEEAGRLPLGQKLQGWAEKLQSLTPQWRNSPAFQRAMQTLAKNVGHEDPKWQKLSEAGEQLRDRWNEWSMSAGFEKFWASRRFQLPDAPPMEGMSRFTRAVAENTPNTFSMPQVGTPQVGGGILSALAWLVGAAAAVVCLSQLWRYLQEKNQEYQKQQALLHAWPVNPESVNSREDLIRAYEFLALSRLGSAVKSWNHLAIAAGLGNTPDPLRRNAAFSLTNAYEQARYAPLEDALPREVLAEARHQLCLLAGVKGA